MPTDVSNTLVFRRGRKKRHFRIVEESKGRLFFKLAFDGVNGPVIPTIAGRGERKGRATNHAIRKYREQLRKQLGA